MKITPSQLTVTQLFSSKNEQFFIPAYQRRYAWKTKQLLELFEDVNLLESNDTHFFGTILLLTESHKADINSLEVVDGQQRMISLTLLLKAIKDKFVELDKQDIANEIDEYLSCQGIDRKKQNKIILGDLDEPDYSKILSQKDLGEIKNHDLSSAYDEFRRAIAKYDFNDLNKFYFKLLNNAIVMRLDTGKAKDAYKLFETINNRGLKLSPTDIIKNFLLGHASRIDEPTLEAVRDCWKCLIVYLDGIETDSFFRQYLMGILKRKVTVSKLIFEFKKYYLTTVKEASILSEYRLFNDFEEYGEDNDEDRDDGNEPNEESEFVGVCLGNSFDVEKISIIDFANMLKDAAMVYGKIINRNFDNKKMNQHLYNLERIDSFPAYTFLLGLFQRKIDDQTKIGILKGLETFMLRWHICEYRTSELDSIFPKLSDVDDVSVLDQVKQRLIKVMPPDNEFKNKFEKYNFKGHKNRAKYVLEQFEYDRIADRGEYVISSGHDVHLEHIIPETIDTKKAKKDYGDWVSYLGNGATVKHADYVDKIGNYTLLAQELNIKASNNPFLSKKKEYKKSNIQLTKEIVQKYRVFKFKQVSKRSQSFSILVPKIWNML